MKKSLRKVLKLIGFALLAITVFIFLFIYLIYLGFFGAIPEKADILKINNEEASLVFTSDTIIIGKYFAENRTNIEWNDLPDFLVNAVISTEDKRFYEHKGIDKKSYLRVLFITIILGDQSAGGGSTITQQLAKNIYGRENYGMLTIPVSKIKEAILSQRFEAVYSKKEILLLYLNSVPFCENVYGIEAASNRYFNKATQELNIQEAATLTGMLKANTYYNPRLNPENALNRRNTVLQLMSVNNTLTAHQADSLCQLPLELHYSNLNSDAGNGYFVEQVRKKAMFILKSIKKEDGEVYDIEKDGLRIITTLDLRLQELARKSVAGHLVKMQELLDKEIERRKIKKSWEAEQEKIDKNKQEFYSVAPRNIFDWNGDKVSEMTLIDSIWHYYKMLNAAVLMAEPSTGAVLAWVGGNDYRFLPFDLITARRQAASSLKPLIYAAALEKDMQPCTYLSNSKKEYKDFKDWHPENYDNSVTEDADIAMWYALSHSINLPSIDLYFQTGYENIRNLLSNFGIDAPKNETPAISLGALDVSLYQMVRAYCAFANKGNIPNELVMISKITDSQGKILFQNSGKSSINILSELTSEEITAMLLRVVDSGTGSGMRTRYGITSEIAGKTGTAQNYSDAWFIAYTPGIVIGTWVGAMSPQLHFQSALGSGSSLALPICAEIVKEMETDQSLNRKYLLSFQMEDVFFEFLDCAPFRQKGMKGAFDRWFRIDRKQEPAKEQKRISKEKKPQNTVKEKKNIFKKLFGKKDKNNN